MSGAPRRRRLVRALVVAIVLLPLSVVGLLGWHWEALAPRSWPVTVESLDFTDDGRFLVTLDDVGVLRLHDLENPIDRWRGARRTVVLPGSPFEIARAFSTDRILVGGPGTRSKPGFRAVSVSVDDGRQTALGDFLPLDACVEKDLLLARDLDRWRWRESVRRLSRPDEILWTETTEQRPVNGGNLHLIRGRPALSPDGTTVALVHSTSVTLHPSRTGVLTATIPLEKDSCGFGWAAFDDTGTVIVPTGHWSIGRFGPQGTPKGAFAPWIRDAGFLDGYPNSTCLRGRRLAVHTIPDLDGISALEVHESADLAPVARFPDATNHALSRDGTRLAFVRSDGHLEIVRLP